MRVTVVQAFRGARGSWRRGVQSMRTDAPLKSAARPLNRSLRPKKPARPCWDTLLLLHLGPEGGVRGPFGNPQLRRAVALPRSDLWPSHRFQAETLPSSRGEA